VSRRRGGWSLLELIVVCALLGILLALIMVTVQKVRDSASAVTCLHHLRQLAMACHAHHDEKEKLPPYSTGQDGTIEASWWVHLSPYAGEQSFHDKFTADAQPNPTPNGTLLTTSAMGANYSDIRFEILQCPSDHSQPLVASGLGTTNYLANWYVFTEGEWGCYTRAQRFKDVSDGLSCTVLFAEGYASCDGIPRRALIACCLHNFGITWDGNPSDDPAYLPKDYTMFQVNPQPKGAGECDKWRAQTPHPAMPIALADGSSRLISASIAPALWKQLLKPRDEGPLNLEW
jgi:Tfp pilus assembly protein PilE